MNNIGVAGRNCFLQHLPGVCFWKTEAFLSPPFPPAFCSYLSPVLMFGKTESLVVWNSSPSPLFLANWIHSYPLFYRFNNLPQKQYILRSVPITYIAQTDPEFELSKMLSWKNARYEISSTKSIWHQSSCRVIKGLAHLARGEAQRAGIVELEDKAQGGCY